MQLSRQLEHGLETLTDPRLLTRIEQWAAGSQFWTDNSICDDGNVPREELDAAYRCFRRGKAVDPSYLAALRAVSSSCLVWRGGLPHVNSEHFLILQELFGRLNFEAVSCFAALQEPGRDAYQPRSCDPGLLSKSLLPNIEHPFFDSLRQSGLAEIHRHCSGSDLPCSQWIKLMDTGSARSIVPLQAPPHARKAAIELSNQIFAARDLRKWLNGFCQDKFDQESPEYEESLRRCRLRLRWLSRLPIGMNFTAKYFRGNFPIGLSRPAKLTIESERGFLLGAIRKALLPKCPETFHRALHAYLLICNQVFLIMTQSRSGQKGFSRFNDVHQSEWRREDDGNLSSQIQQAAATGGVRRLELRVSPKKLAKVAKALSDFAITPLHGCSSRQMVPDDFRANLICHLIRIPERQFHGGQIAPTRFAHNRQSARQNQGVISRFRHHHSLGALLGAIDTANSEFHARPEVYAPHFMRLQNQRASDYQPWRPRQLPNLKIAYHAGEDFYHLVSGIRAVDELLTFLNLRAGDRVGHALALGLNYRAWMKRMGNEVHLPQGEWFDNLVWLHRRLARIKGQTSFAYTLMSEIQRLFGILYGHADQWRGVDVCERAWLLRQYHPDFARRSRDSAGQVLVALGFPVPPSELAADSVAIGLWQQYLHDPLVRARGNTMIPVPLDLAWQEPIQALQDEILGEMEQKRIAIEINPTSNLCIGAFSNMDEHPIFRWHPPSPGPGPSPPIIIGSDDPGIFSSELIYEYAFLYEAARAHEPKLDQIERWLEALSAQSHRFSTCRK